FNITVIDQVKPIVKTKPVNIYLDNNGNATLTAAMINNGSTDNCTITAFALSKSTFDCSNTGSNSVWLMVTDGSGNKDSVTANVMVIDTVTPKVITQPLSVNLNSAGTISINAAQLNNNSTDACGIATMHLSKSTFDCSNTGVNTI